MLKSFIGLIVLSVLSSAVQAEVLICKFYQSGQPKSLLIWDSEKGTIETIVGKKKKHQVYTNIQIQPDLKPYGPYGKKGRKLMVFDGEVAAIHIKASKLGASFWKDACMLYPYEAFWGEIPGGLEPMNFIDAATQSSFGPKGVCWSEQDPPVDQQGCGFEGGGGDSNKGGRKCRHEHKNKHEEKSSNR